MPNIEIHGLPPKGKGSAHSLRHAIYFALRDETCIRDTLITVVYDKAYLASGRKVPFIRVFSSPHEATLGIIEKLKQFGLRIEHISSITLYPTIPDERNAYLDAAMGPLEEYE